MRNLQKEQILIVGDTEIDILFAKGAGLSSLLGVLRLRRERDAAGRLRPEHEISSISELPSLVHALKWTAAPAPYDVPNA